MARLILIALLALPWARPTPLAGAAGDTTITAQLKILSRMSLDGLTTSVRYS